MKELFHSLSNQEARPVTGAGYPKSPAIYVFLEEDRAIHVGRTRNLRQRVAGHISSSHYSASFAFKETRRITDNLKASYKSVGSRSALFAESTFRNEFDKQLVRLRTCTIKFLIVDDPVDQYLLELYAALEYGTSLTEFDTH
jgi:hypothetical protein